MVLESDASYFLSNSMDLTYTMMIRGCLARREQDISAAKHFIPLPRSCQAIYSFAKVVPSI